MRLVFANLVLSLIINMTHAEESYKQTPLSPAAEKMLAVPFEPNWPSLSKYEVPEWFRDAKFGIWAHWGPQCQPEMGDWYGRHMYIQGHPQYEGHLKHYGHPSQVGFKDVIHAWKAERWDPQKLVSLYKRGGAKYFFAMANHHDNLDMWNSSHQPWNSVNLGPKKDIVAGWAAAAKKEGLRFGLSVHAAHAWMWYETAQGADKTGPLAGKPYDGKLNKADGKGTWWEGYDPQQLYAQNHALSPITDTGKTWDWRHPETVKPDDAYCENIYNRTIDMLNKFQPDLVYYDDTVLPLYPVSDIGLKLVAHQYNLSAKAHGKNEAVVFGKVLSDDQKKAIVWDIERGQSDKIEPLPWQTCTCIGGWHYDRSIYDLKKYKSAKTVIHMLCDVVSKNGNLLLNIPVRADGTIDELEERIVEEIGAWMNINGEAIYDTRPWKVFGEGPAVDEVNPIHEQGFNEGKGKPLGEEDIRFTSKGTTIYAIVMGKPTRPIRLDKLGNSAGLISSAPKRVTVLGGGEVKFSQDDAALTIDAPKEVPSESAVAFKIEF